MASNSSKEVYFGVVLSYLTTFISLGSSLVLTPIIIRLLGQSEYGLYETIGSFVAYLSVLDLGFSSVVTRYTAKYQNEGKLEDRDKFLYTSRNIYISLCALIIVIGIVFYNLIDVAFGSSFSSAEIKKAHFVFIFVLATTITSIYSQVYKGALNGIEKFVWPKAVQLLKVVLTKLTAIAILFLGGDSVGYTAIMFSFEVAACFLLMHLAHKHVSFVKNKMPRKQLIELFVFTSYLFVLAIVSQLYWQIDKLVLGMMIGTVTVAIYSAAMNIQNILRNVSASLKEVLIPRASRISEDNPEMPLLLTNFMIRSGRVIMIIYGVMLAGITALGSKFITLWLGKEYIDAVPVLLILGYSTFLPTVLLPGEEICKAYNKHGPLTMLYLAVSLANVILTVVLVNRIGMIGAAISSGIGVIAGNTVIALLYYKKKFRINIFLLFQGLFNRLLPVLIITTISGIGIDFLLPTIKWSVLGIELLIICIIYGALLYSFGLNFSEKDLTKKLVMKMKR